MDEEIVSITPDKGLARALLKSVALREAAIGRLDDSFSTLIVEAKYEIIKELVTALMALGGYKTRSHLSLLRYLAESHGFPTNEIEFLDLLRQLCHDIGYRGYPARPGLSSKERGRNRADNRNDRGARPRRARSQW